MSWDGARIPEPQSSTTILSSRCLTGMTCPAGTRSPASGVSGFLTILVRRRHAPLWLAGWLAGWTIGWLDDIHSAEPFQQLVTLGRRMLLALHLLAVAAVWYTTHPWCGLVDSRAKRILSTGLRSCRDRRLTNYDAGLGIAARSILTISRLAGASWV